MMEDTKRGGCMLMRKKTRRSEDSQDSEQRLLVAEG